MAIAVLRPHDCLNDRLNFQAMGSPPPPPLKPNRRKQPRPAPSSPPPRPPPPPGRSIPLLKSRSPLPSHHKQAGRSNQAQSGGRRVSFSGKESAQMVVKLPSRKLLMGGVKILKRGDPLPAAEDLRLDLAGGEDLSPAAEDLRSDLAGGEDLSPAVEDLRSDFAGGEELSPLFTAELLGPDPEILPKQPEILPKQIGFSKVMSVYAGPAYITSPSPSSVPLPGFFFKKGSLIDDASAIATKGLCDLLRLHPIN